VFRFSKKKKLLSGIFLVPRRTETDMIKNVKYSYSCQILVKLAFTDRFPRKKNYQISNFVKFRPWESSCSMRTDRRTDRHDEANSCLRNFVNVLKYTKFEVFLLLFSSENLQCTDVNIQIQKKLDRLRIT